MVNLALNLTKTAEKTPDHVALECGDIKTTYAEFADQSLKVAAFLKGQGIEPGDSVGLMLPNVPAFAVAYYGILSAGATVVPMNPVQSGREVQFFLENTGAKLLFVTPDFEAEGKHGTDATGAILVPLDDAKLADLIADVSPIDGPVDRDDDDNAVILHTSGTTGKPKGAELTHHNMTSNCDVTANYLFGMSGDDLVMGCLPLFHAFGMTCTLNAVVNSGAGLVLIPRFDAGKVLQIITDEPVTIFEGVPTMYSGLLAASAKQEFDTGKLRLAVSGGAAMPVEVLKNFEETFGCKILEGYGLSETSPVACFNPPTGERKVGSIGLPVENVEMRITGPDRNPLPDDEVGEVEVKGPNVMKGYLGLPDATASAIQDGWFATGDLGRRDSDGYYYIVDRKKEMIIRGGFNVYPREIEEVLYSHPAIAEAAVVGIAHPSLGEEVGAAIAFKDGLSATVQEVQDFVKEQVAKYKYPRHIWIVDELPKGPTGKILRREVKVPEEAQNA